MRGGGGATSWVSSLPSRALGSQCHSGWDQAACNWIHAQCGPCHLPQAPGYGPPRAWGARVPVTQGLLPGVCAPREEPATPVLLPLPEPAGLEPRLRPELPPLRPSQKGSWFSLSQLVWDFWLQATDGGPDWPFCVLLARPAQATASGKPQLLTDPPPPSLRSFVQERREGPRRAGICRG